MPEVYLTYVERHHYGSEPSGVTFFAGISPVELSDDNIKISLSHVLTTNNSPRQVLESLEKKVYEAIREKPSVRDILQGTSDDSRPKYADWPRQSGYLAHGSWPKVGETQEHAAMRTKESNAIRNEKLLEVYLEFIASVSAKPTS